MTPVLNRTTGPQILRLFDVCFKQGVIDAFNFGNDFDAKEFLEEKQEDWSFGILGEDAAVGWEPFLFTLYWWSRKNKLTSLADNFIFKIKRINHLWCLLPYCMRFYLLGIDEWLQYPNPMNIEYFKRNNKIHWNPEIVPFKIAKNDYFYYMQDFAHKYRKLPEEEQKISPFTMDGFCRALYDVTRNYDASAKEDL